METPLQTKREIRIGDLVIAVENSAEHYAEKTTDVARHDWGYQSARLRVKRVEHPRQAPDGKVRDQRPFFVEVKS